MRCVTTRILVATAIGAVAMAGSDARAAVWSVAPEGTGDAPTLQAAIDAATEGDVIRLAPGIYRDRVTRDLNGSPATAVAFLKSGVVIEGEEGSLSTFLDGEEDHHCLVGEDLDGDTVVRGLTLLHGDALDGQKPNGRDGGGLLLHRSSPLLEHIRFVGCNAVRGGGGLSVRGGHDDTPIVLRGCAFVFCWARSRGGGAELIDVAEAEVENNTFAGNFADEAGGGLALVGTPSEVDRNVFWWNCSHLRGGAIFCEETSSVEAACNVFWENIPEIGETPGSGKDGDCDIDVGDDGNIVADPMFCDVDGEDFTLDALSPAAAENSGQCGSIGAYPVACGLEGRDVIAGLVTARDGRTRVAGVTLAPQRPGDPSPTTDPSGRFFLEDPPPGRVVVRPVLAAIPPGPLSALDASLALCGARGLVELDENDRAAADFDGDGVLTERDAGAILACAAGVVSQPMPTWTTVPRTRAFDYPGGLVRGIDFRAVLRGDVTGNVDPRPGSTPIGPVAPVALSGEWLGERYRLVVVPGTPARSLDLRLAFDPGVFELESVNGPTGAIVATGPTSDGVLVAVATAEPWAAGSGVSFVLRAPVGRIASTLNVSSVRVDEAPAPDTELTVPGTTSPPGSGLRVRVWPNPAVGSVRLFVGGSAGRIAGGIYDVQGRRLRTLPASRAAGPGHVLEWDGRDDRGRSAAAGVYFARVTSGNESRFARIILRR